MSDERRQAIVVRVWDAILKAYGQDGRTRVQLPIAEVVGMLDALKANLISQLDDPKERARMIRGTDEVVTRMVDRQRAKPNVYLPSRNGLVI